MRRLLRPATRARTALADAAGVGAFVLVGSLSHNGGLDVGDLTVDLAAFEAGWFAAAAAAGVYRRPSAGRLAATWLAGVAAGLGLRAVLLQRDLDVEQLQFLVASLVFVGAFAAAARMAVSLRPARP
jgi:DUF3054 family protein